VKTEIYVYCSECKRFIKKIDGKGESGIRLGLCPRCSEIVFKELKDMKYLNIEALHKSKE